MWPFNRKKKLSEQDKRDIRRRMLSARRSSSARLTERRAVTSDYGTYDDFDPFMLIVWQEILDSSPSSPRYDYPWNEANTQGSSTWGHGIGGTYSTPDYSARHDSGPSHHTPSHDWGSSSSSGSDSGSGYSGC